MNQILTTDQIMSEEDRVKEAYFAIMDILAQYKCKFECSVTLKNNDQHFTVDVVVDDDEKEEAVS